MENENPTAVWVRKKLRNNEPFLLDELTPAGVPFYVALDWPDDDNKDGYRAAKKKVADRVPAQDWSLIDSDESSLFPQKSAEINEETRGRKKQRVALSANGVKHLLAHVPNKELANGWMQHLIDAEHDLLLTREAHNRDSLCETHKKANQAVIENHGVKQGSGLIAIATNMFFDKSGDGMKQKVKDEKGLKAQLKNINQWNYATRKSMAHKQLLAANLAASSLYAEREDTLKDIASVAAGTTLGSIRVMSKGADIAVVPKSDGKGFRECVVFEVKDGPALPPAKARNELNKDKARRQAEEALTPRLPGL